MAPSSLKKTPWSWRQEKRPPSEGYELTVAADGIRIIASEPAGLFWGVQTLLQLLPSSTSTAGLRVVRATAISDYPRFANRGAILDGARHFFEVDDVTSYIDAIALLMFNVLHLTVDQGWRLQIIGWARLTEHGGSTQVGGGGGSFYSQDDYRELVEYVASSFVTIVPEIDLSGHTTAALASYPELACDGHAPHFTRVSRWASPHCAEIWSIPSSSLKMYSVRLPR